MATLAGCLLAHAVLAQAPIAAWWVPDLTLVGMVLVIGRAPARWPLWAGMAALWAMLWAIRMPWLVGVSYLGCGWGVRRLCDAWETTDLRLQGLMIGLASLLITIVLLWIDRLWSLPMAAWTVVHVGVTAGTLWLFLLARRGRARRHRAPRTTGGRR